MPKIVWVIAAAVAFSFALRFFFIVRRHAFAIVIDEAIKAEKSDIDERGSGSFPRGEA